MNKATELLKEAKTFFIATVEGDQPRGPSFRRDGGIRRKNLHLHE